MNPPSAFVAQTLSALTGGYPSASCVSEKKILTDSRLTLTCHHRNYHTIPLRRSTGPGYAHTATSALAAIARAAAWSIACCFAGMLAIYAPTMSSPADWPTTTAMARASRPLLVILGSLVVFPIGLGIVRVAGPRAYATRLP